MAYNTIRELSVSTHIPVKNKKAFDVTSKLDAFVKKTATNLAGFGFNNDLKDTTCLLIVEEPEFIELDDGDYVFICINIKYVTNDSEDIPKNKIILIRDDKKQNNQ